MVFCMTESHVEQVFALEPQARGKVARLREEGDIEDPIGGGNDVYWRTARQIETALKRRFEKGLP
jgi:protein-tyrosine-phosphatase